MSNRNRHREIEPEEPKQEMKESAEEIPVNVEESAQAPEAAQEAEKPSEGKKDDGSVTLTAEEFQKAQDHIAELVKQIGELRKKNEETVNLLQRNQADFDNYRKRNASIRADSIESGKQECIKALLPVLDNFDRAMGTESDDGNGWRAGIELVHRQLLDVLGKMGMTEIETDGKFDPNVHEAVMQESAEDKESGDITAVFQKGYRVGKTVIRPSMVKVAQ